MRRKVSAVISIVAMIAVAAAWIHHSNSTFEENFYTIDSYKIEESVRVILLADLHQTMFGSGNERLFSRIKVLKPDIILIAGDVVNKKDTDWNYAVDLCRKLMEIAPVYYGLGNHENEALYGEDLNKEFLEASAKNLGDSPEDFSPLNRNTNIWDEFVNVGVNLLQNESTIVNIKGNSIKIGGLSTNSSSFWPYSGNFITRFIEEDLEVFKILIAHRPEPIMKYISDSPIDLVVSGHNHGGIIRIPGIGGLVSEAEGLFPEYDAGLFESGDMTLLISHGLGGHGLVPRVFNQPELVVLDID